jgi:hypothetical protein
VVLQSGTSVTISITSGDVAREDVKCLQSNGYGVTEWYKCYHQHYKR